MEKPYTDIETCLDYVIREFDENIDPIELLWHRDDEQRLVEVLECGQGWKMQMDDQLPTSLEPGVSIFILRHQWHRVIKGEGKLLVKIHKNEG
jgi:quercetin dioxygenase-like cupin family protein